MPRVVRYTRYGSPDVLEMVEAPRPDPGAGELRIRVAAAGLNPVDYKIFGGRGTAGETPRGVGHDFAGVVDAVGDGVTAFAVGDPVYGGSRDHALADFLLIAQDGLLHRVPDGLDLETAACLAISARTAAAAVRAMGVGPDDTVLVSAAAGGVGVLAAQLAARTGARVIGTASEVNHDFLRSLGVTPVSHGHGLVDRLREAAPSGISCVLDNHGEETIDAALDLGVPLERINTIAARGYRGATGEGGADARPDDLPEIAAAVAAGTIVLPIDAVFPLERVRDAYRMLQAGHVRGKIVVVM